MIPCIACLYAVLALHPAAAPVYKPIPRAFHVASLLAAQADVAMTIEMKEQYGSALVEHNPLARPFVDKPNAVYELMAMGAAISLNKLADRWATDPKMHKFARPILVAQIAANAFGFGYTFRHRNGN